MASEIKHPESIRKLIEYTGGLEGKKVAFIPTGSNGEVEFGDWKGGSWKAANSLGAEVKAVQLEDYKNSSVIKELEDQDVIWMHGGVTGYLLYWIRRCELDKHLPRLLATSLYIGSSAGCMILAKDQDLAEWYIGEQEPGASLIPGLGLVDFNFYPHYEDHLYNEVKAKYRGNKMYLVKDGEVIIVEDGKVRVLGEERIITL
ncbi:MAG: Type 1 glutamine amidotransferase-like domain-containing protein [Candidatus Dojkabacteria bacterium]|nr:MAG: Type 1 glutamine amidotransferase-like domain-containing protein [Candidatus Dojkabacteria bacterium]